jgi:acyl-CoA thioester hydrolase
MNGFRCVIPIVIRFSDCDPLGHVNNATYFTYLEEARFHWFKTVLGENAFERNPIILGEATCTFRSQAKYGDALEVGIRVERIGRASFEHRYKIEATRDRRLIAEAKTTGIGFDYANNESRPLGEEFAAAIRSYQGPLPGQD